MMLKKIPLFYEVLLHACCQVSLQKEQSMYITPSCYMAAVVLIFISFSSSGLLGGGSWFSFIRFFVVGFLGGWFVVLSLGGLNCHYCSEPCSLFYTLPHLLCTSLNS